MSKVSGIVRINNLELEYAELEMMSEAFQTLIGNNHRSKIETLSKLEDVCNLENKVQAELEWYDENTKYIESILSKVAKSVEFI